MYETYGCCFYKELYDYLKDIIDPNNIQEERFKTLSHLRSSFKKTIFNPDNIKNKQTNTIKDVPKLDDLLNVLKEYCNVHIYYSNKSNITKIDNNKDITVSLYKENDNKYGIFLKSDQELPGMGPGLQEEIIKKLKFDIPSTPTISSRKRIGQEIENIQIEAGTGDPEINISPLQIFRYYKDYYIDKKKLIEGKVMDTLEELNIRLNTKKTLIDTLKESKQLQAITNEKLIEKIEEKLENILPDLDQPRAKRSKLRYQKISKRTYKKSRGRKIKRYPKNK